MYAEYRPHRGRTGHQRHSDHARAQLLYRLVGPAEELRKQIMQAVGNLAEAEFVLEIPFMKLRTVAGH